MEASFSGRQAAQHFPTTQQPAAHFRPTVSSSCAQRPLPLLHVGRQAERVRHGQLLSASGRHAGSAATRLHALPAPGEVGDVEELAGMRVVMGDNDAPAVEYLVKWKARSLFPQVPRLRSALLRCGLVCLVLVPPDTLCCVWQGGDEQTWCARQATALALNACCPSSIPCHTACRVCTLLLPAGTARGSATLPSSLLTPPEPDREPPANLADNLLRDFEERWWKLCKEVRAALRAAPSQARKFL